MGVSNLLIFILLEVLGGGGRRCRSSSLVVGFSNFYGKLVQLFNLSAVIVDEVWMSVGSLGVYLEEHLELVVLECFLEKVGELGDHMVLRSIGMS